MNKKIILLFVILFIWPQNVLSKEKRRVSLSATEEFLSNHPFFAEAYYCNGAFCGTAYRNLTDNRRVYYDFSFLDKGGLFQEKIYIVRNEKVPKSIRLNEYEDQCNYWLLDALINGGILYDTRTMMGGPRTVSIDELIDIDGFTALQKSYDYCQPVDSSQSFLKNTEKVTELLKLIYGEKSLVLKEFKQSKKLSKTHYFYLTKDEYYQTKIRKKLNSSKDVNIYLGNEFTFYVYDFAIYIREKGEFLKVSHFLDEDKEKYQRLKERSKLTKPYDL